MARIRRGNQAVLLVVDVQVGVMRGTWETARVIANINRAVEKARRAGVPVVWVQHADNQLVYGSPDWELSPELSPAANEVKIDKQYNSSFENTPLEETLWRLGVTHIVLAGASTNFCIRATAYAALDRGYDLTLLQDAHTTDTLELENGIKIEAKSVIDDLNIVMNWLGYPDVKNCSLPVEKLDFSALGGENQVE